MRASCYLSTPCGQRTASSFYRPRGGGLQSCRVALSVVCGSMAYNVVELTTVLANLASGRRRGGSCARLGAASRVVVSESSLDRRPYANSGAWLTEDRSLHRCPRPAAPRRRTALPASRPCRASRPSYPLQSLTPAAAGRRPQPVGALLSMPAASVLLPPLLCSSSSSIFSAVST
jgi:hypothetical protein